eukprot:scaffold5878_cov179-Ochromonas_danica.AAC.3
MLFLYESALSPLTYVVLLALFAVCVNAFTAQTGSWILTSDIPGTQRGEQAGYSVSLSRDGSILAIGSNSYNNVGYAKAGRVRVFNISGASWRQLGADIVGTQSNEVSGFSVSLNGNGSIVAVGSYMFDSSNFGRTRIFSYNGSAWIQMGVDIVGSQNDEELGFSVSLSWEGTIVAIGARGYSVSNNSKAGRVCIFRYSTSSSSWVQIGTDIVGTQSNEKAGRSVSLSGNGETVALGSDTYIRDGSTNTGRVRVFTFSATDWIQLGADIEGNQDGEQAGFAVSLSKAANIVAIGSNSFDNGSYTNTGRVRVFNYNGTSWTQLGMDILGNKTGEASGTSVSLSEKGSVVAIGSYGYTYGTYTNAGRVRIFGFSSSSWSQLGADIVGSYIGERSGASVSLTWDGRVCVEGSPVFNNSVGRALIYSFNFTSQPTSLPTGIPSSAPSVHVDRTPTGQPSGEPTTEPSSHPSGQPSGQPSSSPSVYSEIPSSRPSTAPSTEPSSQ